MSGGLLVQIQGVTGDGQVWFEFIIVESFIKFAPEHLQEEAPKHNAHEDVSKPFVLYIMKE